MVSCTLLYSILKVFTISSMPFLSTVTTNRFVPASNRAMSKLLAVKAFQRTENIDINWNFQISYSNPFWWLRLTESQDICACLYYLVSFFNFNPPRHTFITSCWVSSEIISVSSISCSSLVQIFPLLLFKFGW